MNETTEYNIPSLILCQSIIRTKLAQDSFSRLKKLSSTRYLICSEILNTEKTYVNSLIQAQEHYYKPLSENKLLSPQELKQIFPPTLQIILNLNKLFLSELQQRSERLYAGMCIADLFKKFAGCLGVYIDYVGVYNEAINTYVKCLSRHSNFASFIKTTAEGLMLANEFIGEVPALLITPIQRVPRYILLLEELNKRTWDDHPDKENIIISIQKFRSIATTINERQRDFENINKVFQIQLSLTGRSESILAPQRRYLFDGNLTVKKGEKRKVRRLFLFNDVLLETKQKKEKFKVIDKPVPLDWIRLIPSPDPNAIDLESQRTKGKITYFADTPEEKEKWSNMLSNAITKYTTNKELRDFETTQIAKKRATHIKEQINSKYTSLTASNTNTPDGTGRRNTTANILNNGVKVMIEELPDPGSRLQPSHTYAGTATVPILQSPRPEFGNGNGNGKGSSEESSDTPSTYRKWSFHKHTLPSTRSTNTLTSDFDPGMSTPILPVTSGSHIVSSEKVKEMIEKHYSGVSSQLSLQTTSTPRLRKHAGLRNRTPF